MDMIHLDRFLVVKFTVIIEDYISKYFCIQTTEWQALSEKTEDTPRPSNNKPSSPSSQLHRSIFTKYSEPVVTAHSAHRLEALQPPTLYCLLTLEARKCLCSQHMSWTSGSMRKGYILFIRCVASHTTVSTLTEYKPPSFLAWHFVVSTAHPFFLPLTVDMALCSQADITTTLLEAKGSWFNQNSAVLLCGVAGFQHSKLLESLYPWSPGRPRYHTWFCGHVYVAALFRKYHSNLTSFLQRIYHRNFSYSPLTYSLSSYNLSL